MVFLQEIFDYGPHMLDLRILDAICDGCIPIYQLYDGIPGMLKSTHVLASGAAPQLHFWLDFSKPRLLLFGRPLPNDFFPQSTLSDPLLGFLRCT
jgi:hypothetical protein